MNVHCDFSGRTLDLNLCNASRIQLFLQKFTDFVIRDQVVCEGFAISEPARIPIFDDTDTETVRINFLAHTTPSYLT